MGQLAADVVGPEPAGFAPGRTMFLLVSSFVLSLVLLLLPLYLLAWYWPGVPHGTTCDTVSQEWCTPGAGLPHWYAVAAACATAGVLHLMAAVRWRRSSARKLSLLGLLAAAAAFALVTLAPTVLSGIVPDTWLLH
jgi:hypothetical protein